MNKYCPKLYAYRLDYTLHILRTLLGPKLKRDLTSYLSDNLQPQLHVLSWCPCCPGPQHKHTVQTGMDQIYDKDFTFPFQKKTAAGQPIFNLEKKRHGKKYIVKAVKEGKDYSFRDILASWTLEVMCICLAAQSQLCRLSVVEAVVVQAIIMTNCVDCIGLLCRLQ